MNVGRYLRGEDRHVGTARTTQPQPPKRTEQEPKDWKTPLKEDAPLVKWAKEQTAPQRTWVGLTDEEIE
jgi:hypothetical protein